MNKSTAKNLCFHLLPSYTAGAKVFENIFGTSSLEEKALLNTLTLLARDEFNDQAEIWKRYEEMLADCRPHTPKLTLKRALALRHVVDFPERRHGPLCTCYLSKNVPDFLEKSLALDPLDKQTYLKLIDYFKERGNRSHFKKWIKNALTALPNDRELLFTAIKAARLDKSPAQGINLSKKLIKLDPLNKLARQYAVEFQLKKAHALALQNKVNEAEAFLRKLKPETPVALHLPIQINLGLCEYLQGNLSAARLTLQHCNEHDVLFRVLTFIESNKFQIPLSSIDRGLFTASSMKMTIKDKTQLLELINLISECSDIPQWRDIITYIKKPLQNALNFSLVTKEFTSLCECFTELRQFDLIQDLVKKQPHLMNEPILIYYRIHSKIKGNAKKLSDRDFDLLADAFDLAEEKNDTQTSTLIDDLLEESAEEEEEDYGSPFSLDHVLKTLINAAKKN